MLREEDVCYGTVFSLSDEVPQPPDRRRDQRHLTILRVGKLITPRSQELCLVRNISAGGLMAHVYSPQVLNENVVVELRDDQQIAGMVQWIKDSNIGIQFDHNINVAELLSNPVAARGTRPRPPRIELPCRARLRVGSERCQVVVRDISQGGAKIVVDMPLYADDAVVITLEGFRPMAAAVRWARGGEAGIEFNQIIPYRELAHWLAKICG